MTRNYSRGKGFFRVLLSGNSSRPILLRGDLHKKGVTISACRTKQEHVIKQS